MMTGRRAGGGAVLIALLTVLTLPATSRADELRPGYMELTESDPGEWRVAWKLPLTSLPDARPPAPVFPASCRLQSDPDISVLQMAVVGSAALICDGGLQGESIGMPALLGQADMLVRIQPLGTGSQALRLTARAPVAVIARTTGTARVPGTYFVLGLEHILAGWDHLLFVIAMVLLIGSWRRVVLAATAFTVAHSITLAAASLGVVGLPQRPVEALIALSIVFLALEILRHEAEGPTLTQRYPWVVAFLFGLLHGFGFAGALSAIGLPENAIIAALLAFNIGVEAGQLLVVVAVLAVIALLRRAAPPALTPATGAAAYGIGMMGAYWLLARTVLGGMG